MKALKVAVIGAGSTYTPELVEGLIDHASSLPLRELALVDINQERLDILADFANRMLRHAGLDVAITRHADRRAAIDGADFVLNQIRVGGQEARIRDEQMGRRHGVIGQETTGPGGFAKALRTIPVALAIAQDIEELAPGAWMINFTNPAGMVTESLLRFGGVKCMGLCNSPFGLQVGIARAAGVDPGQVRLDYVGLNHLSWVRRVYVEGVDRTDAIIESYVAERRSPFDVELIATLRMIPSGYLRYFYHQQRVLEEQREGKPTRGQEVWEIEKQLLAQYRDPGLCCKPPLLEKRGGAHYSTLAVSLVNAIANDLDELHIVDCRNGGCLADLPEDVAVEMPAIVNAKGAHPLAAGSVPFSIRGLMQHVKAYEELTIEAAVGGDERTALLALTANPLVPSFEKARELWADIKRDNADFLSAFKRNHTLIQL